jgi:hypothetical protein
MSPRRLHAPSKSRNLARAPHDALPGRSGQEPQLTVHGPSADAADTSGPPRWLLAYAAQDAPPVAGPCVARHPAGRRPPEHWERVWRQPRLPPLWRPAASPGLSAKTQGRYFGQRIRTRATPAFTPHYESWAETPRDVTIVLCLPRQPDQGREAINAREAVGKTAAPRGIRMLRIPLGDRDA